jgi:hypothetical protein
MRHHIHANRDGINKVTALRYNWSTFHATPGNPLETAEFAYKTMPAMGMRCKISAAVQPTLHFWIGLPQTH